MNDLIQNLLEQLRGTSAGTKLIALLSGASLVVVIGLAGVASKRPDFQLAFSGLTDHEVAKVNKALAQAGIAFTSSSPPAPFNVYVDEADRSAAFAAAYGAGALDKPLQGILSESGVASVFNSAEERRQGVRKKEWQEMERMLESLDFVATAYVRTSPQASSPIAAREAQPVSASVVLRTNGTLTHGQQENIAKMVSHGLGVRREDLVISDHEGNTLYDGVGLDEPSVARDHLEQQLQFDARLTQRANDLLNSILGPDKARVSVTSEWDYEQSTTRAESTSGKGQLLEESVSTTDRPIQRQNVPAGLSANVLSADGDNTRLGELGPTEKETTSDTKKTYRPSLTVQEKVSLVPTVKRLAVALYLDESITAEQVADLESAVQASVGFDAERDQFSSVSLPFFIPEVEEEKPAAAEPEGAAPNPLMDTLLRRGVEILTAGAFLMLLLRTLKSSNKATAKAESSGAGAGATASEESSEPPVDQELLAQAQVDELLRSDPDRVSELLSSWVLEEDLAGTKS